MLTIEDLTIEERLTILALDEEIIKTIGIFTEANKLDFYSKKDNDLIRLALRHLLSSMPEPKG